MKIAPSVLTADFTDLENELKSIETADYLHLDIMDGHFVPNISFGPAISKMISQKTNLPLDIHLMVTDPYQWIDGFTYKNTKYITIHVESNDVRKTMDKIKSNHVKLGLSVKPKTSIDELMPFIHEVDLVLVMTVEPGFGGQSFMHDMMDKVKELVEIRKKYNLSFEIEVDGGISDQTIEIARLSGVDVCVAGSYLFNLKDRKKGILSLK
jgi:ribulose-phosphate 3-epimerase